MNCRSKNDLLEKEEDEEEDLTSKTYRKHVISPKAIISRRKYRKMPSHHFESKLV